MKSSTNSYAGYRYPPEIIAHAVWVYHRFYLSFRDVEDLLAERDIIAGYEAVRQWCYKFDQSFASSLHRRQGRPGDTWFLHEAAAKSAPLRQRANPYWDARMIQ
jgi:putative transposase